MDTIIILTERQVRAIISDEVWNCLKNLQPPASATSPLEEDIILTLDEFANYLKVSSSLIYRDPSKWGGMKVATQWRFRKSTADALLAKGGADQK